MASTYTAAGIELIAQGEQAGAWGNTTNTNWALVEEMIGGVVDITLTGSTYSLTTSDGASSEGRHSVLNFSGSPGATCTVTVTPNDMQKVYFVVNGSDQTVTISQGSGANVSVSAGKNKIVFCDGAGAGAAVTDISSGFDATTLAELGVTASAAELNTLDGITANVNELNILDGATLDVTELNYVDGVTSSIQTQLDAKAPLASPALTGTATAVNLTLSGDLTVNGTTTTVNSTNTVVSDTLLELGNGTTGTPANDAGLVIERGDSNNAFMGFDESADKFIVGTGTFTGASTGDLTITTGTLVANIEGNVTGNVTGNTSGSSGSCTGNAATATTLQTARTIGGVSFDGSANINLPGVNTAGNQNTSGNAATATAWATGRTITLTGDVTGTSGAFNGSANLSFATTVGNDSHSHTTSTLSGNVSAFTNDSGYVTSSGVTSVATGAGLSGGTITSTGTISIDSDLRGDVFYIGRDTNDYYLVNTTTHDWYLDGVLDMRLTNAGTLHCDGDVIAYSTTTSSDENLKDNIRVVEDSIGKLKQLRGVEFEWKKDGKSSAGVIAQDVEKVLPQAVKTVEDLNTQEPYKTVNYDALHALLIEAVKELSAKVEELEAKVG